MNLIALIILISTGVIALVTGYTLYYKRVYRCRKTRNWVKRVEEAQTDDELTAIDPIEIYGYSYDGHRHMRNTARQQAAISKWRDAKLRNDARKHHAKFVLLDTPYDRAFSYITGDRAGYDYALAFGKNAEEVARDLTCAMAETLVLVRAGDRVAMNGYVQVMDYSSSRSNLPTPAYPADWDDLVVEFIPNPSVSDFKNTQDLAIGEVRLMAAEALAKQSRKLAKLVLAYCLVEREVLGDASYGSSYYGSGGRSRQIAWPYRDAIGDTLLARLIIMVDAMEGSSTYSQAIKLNKPAS